MQFLHVCYCYTSYSSSSSYSLRSTSNYVSTFTSCNIRSRNLSILYEAHVSSGDELRKATGIRPSLHPMTINALSEALLIRAKKAKIWGSDDENNGTPSALQIALLAGELAADALLKREEMLKDRTNVSALSPDKSLNDVDDNEWEMPTIQEKQLVSGRVIGVTVRLKDLEKLLVEKVGSVGWVNKYGEHASFGILASEVKAAKSDEGFDNKGLMQVQERIKIDPLFRMSRAECLLALFIENIEKPQFEKMNENVIDGGSIDFIDADRIEVLNS